MVSSEEMFMLFFSILFGIVLSSLVGRGPFPISSAFALKDLKIGKKKKGTKDVHETEWVKGYRSLRRLTLAVILLNLLPILYFALTFTQLGSLIGENVSTAFQIISIGFMGLSVFGFYYFFLGFSMLRYNGELLFYTDFEHGELIKERRTIYPESWSHFLSGTLYFAIPWLTVFLFKGLDLLA